MKRTPTTVRQTAPSPPRMLVPPTTIPASTANASAVSPVDACALSTRDVSITPASPAAPPLITNVRMRILLTRTPASRAASGVPPRLGVAAGGVHVAPGGRRRQQDADHDDRQDHQPDRRPHPQPLGAGELPESGLVEEDEQVPLRDQGCAPADDEGHRERGDQRVDAQHRRQEAVGETDEKAGADSEE